MKPVVLLFPLCVTFHPDLDHALDTAAVPIRTRWHILSSGILHTRRTSHPSAEDIQILSTPDVLGLLHRGIL